MRFDAFALRKYVGTRMRCTIIAQLDFATSLTRSAYFSPNIEELLAHSDDGDQPFRRIATTCSD
jgi:hypothetical protein